MTTQTGLRDQKKAATRAALGVAAIRLARAQGYDSVTAESIAREAGVSTRTFHNYFAGKEDAILFFLERSALEWVDRLRARPADEEFWDSVRHIVFRVVENGEQEVEETIAVAHMVESTPALLTRKLALNDTLTRAFTTAVADRLGLDPDRDLYPRMIQAVLGAAVSCALTIWHDDPQREASPYRIVEQALRQLESGMRLPEPLPADVSVPSGPTEFAVPTPSRPLS